MPVLNRIFRDVPSIQYRYFLTLLWQIKYLCAQKYLNINIRFEFVCVFSLL